ncbi:MAG: peptidylprolyl isomerase [Nitrospiria bacterium]
MLKLSSKVIFFCFVILCFRPADILIAAESGSEATSGDSKGPDPRKTVAEVNGKPILLSDLQGGIKRAELNLGHKELSPARVDEIKKEVLEKIISKELILQEAKKENIDPDLLVRREIYEKAIPSDEEVKAYFQSHPDEFMRPEGVRLIHLLVRVDPSSLNEGWKAGYMKALELSNRANQGEDFEKMVQKYSDPESRYFGGDLTIQYKGQMAMAEFESVAFSLKEKEVSLPIQTLYGFSLIQVVEKIAPKLFSFSDINQESLKKKVGKNKEMEISDSWIKSLRSQAIIKYYPE